MKPIPYGRQDTNDADIQAVIDVLKSDWLTCGPAVTVFEDTVRDCLGVKHAIAVSNGTAALHLCCLALGIQSGDTGVTSPLTFLSSANCIAYCGGRPDFVDIDPDTYCLSPEKLEEYIEKNGTPRVVIPVDFAGVPADLPRIWTLAQKYGFALIEDAAHSIGSSYRHGDKAIQCGACVHSDFAIFSFHPVKTVTAGEGGMVLTNDDELAVRVRALASHGMEREVHRFQPWSLDNTTGRILDELEPLASSLEKAPWLYQQQELGYNYRITDIQCALGTSQFRRIDETVKHRHAIFEQYQEAFAPNDRLIRPPCGAKGVDTAYHLYVLRFIGTVETARFKACATLRTNDIFAQVHYIPVYLQPWYQKQYGYQRGKCSEAEAIYSNCLSIPLYPTMGNKDIERVIRIVNGFTE